VEGKGRKETINHWEGMKEKNWSGLLVSNQGIVVERRRGKKLPLKRGFALKKGVGWGR